MIKIAKKNYNEKYGVLVFVYSKNLTPETKYKINLTNYKFSEEQ